MAEKKSPLKLLKKARRLELGAEELNRYDLFDDCCYLLHQLQIHTTLEGIKEEIKEIFMDVVSQKSISQKLFEENAPKHLKRSFLAGVTKWGSIL